LPKDSTERELLELFAQAGTVKQVAIKFDRGTGRQRGFAFVTMASEDEAAWAIRHQKQSLRALKR
jgi:RNA recognition motif-containing protein